MPVMKAAETGIQMRYYNDRQCPTFIRAFDPNSDALYIPLHKWDEFLIEPYDRACEPDLFERKLQVYSNITYVAVPEELLHKLKLSELFGPYHNVTLVFPVVGVQPDIESVDDNWKLQHRWEFEITEGKSFFSNVDRDSSDSGNCNGIDDEAVYKFLEKVGTELSMTEALARASILNFEMRPVFAIRIC